jgi:hypothetical protein
MSDLSPLWGEERKSDFGAARSVDDLKMCEREIAVGLDASAQLSDRLDVGIEINARVKTSRGERRNAAPPPTDTVRALWLEGGRVRSFEGLLQTTYSGAQGDCVVPYPPRPLQPRAR